MPNGHATEKPVVTIDVVPPRTGTRGRIDKLYRDYLTKAEALRITAGILDEDERQQALHAAPKKFLQAINHRNGNGPRSQEERRETHIAAIREYLTAHPGASTRDIAAAIQRSTATVLKFVNKIARPAEKRKRGSKLPWSWLLKEMKTKTTTTKMTNGSGKPQKFYAGRQSPAHRRQELIDYLRTHSGEDTNQIAEGLGWRRALVAKFVKKVAVRGARSGPKQPYTWTLTARSANKVAAKVKATPKKNGVIDARANKRSAEDWQADIRAYLTDHPEAYTSEIGKAVRRTPNSQLIKLIRTVARPARATTKTQPIPWVLADAAS